MMEENKMGVMPVRKLVINMALPMIISMLIGALYNVVDSLFVSRFSEDALSAVSLAFPVQNIIIAIADAEGIAGETLNRAIYEMKQRCYGIVNSDGTNRAAALAARYHARHYGSGTVDTDNLPSMKQFANEADFLAAVLPADVNASYFAEAVNN